MESKILASSAQLNVPYRREQKVRAKQIQKGVRTICLGATTVWALIFKLNSSLDQVRIKQGGGRKGMGLEISGRLIRGEKKRRGGTMKEGPKNAGTTLTESFPWHYSQT